MMLCPKPIMTQAVMHFNIDEIKIYGDLYYISS